MKWTLFILILLFQSCQDNKKQINQNMPLIEQGDNPIEIIRANDTMIIIDSHFAIMPFGEKLVEPMLTKFVKPNHFLQKIPWTNENMMEIDTFILSTDKLDSIIFYKSSNLFSLNNASIKTDRYILDKNIKIGMSKSDFCKAFDINDCNNDTTSIVIVKDLEEYSIHSFSFDVGKELKHIELYHHID